ncbi:MAG: ABC transporter ATP-binding protein [Thermodesulfobacteriota bacterium]
MDTKLLEVEDLTKVYHVSRGGMFSKKMAVVRAVDGVNFSVSRGETLGLVGESGCGKTTLSRCLIRLVEPTSGKIRFDGVDVLGLNWGALRKLRAKLQIIYQDPYSSLDPRKCIMDIVGEPLIVHRVGSKDWIKSRVVELLEEVGLGVQHLDLFPHELSGGQRQRVNIARALALRPQFIIADEPVSALDVSIQAQVLNLILGLQKKFDLTYLFISHDLRVVEHMSDRIAVMYLGRIVEMGKTDEIFLNACHPYTQILIQSMPSITAKERRSKVISGEIPSPVNPPSGCYFHPRCSQKQEICAHQFPESIEVGPGHWVACHQSLMGRIRKD